MGHLLNNAKAHYRAQEVLQKEEKIAKQMLDALPIPFYVANPETYELILYNKAFENFVGSERLGQEKCYSILHDFTEPCAFCGISQMHQGEKTKIWQHHNEMFKTDFTIIANRISWGHVENAHAVAFVDITDALHIQREQVLEREAAKMKARFLANMSHELRTPVNGIMGITRLALKHSTNDHVLEYLDKIQFSSQVLLTVINNVLDFLKIDAGKMDLEQCDFHVQEIFQRLEKNFRCQAEAKGLALHFFPSHAIPPVLQGDSMRFLQILENLLSNAIKFTDEGHICVECSGKLSEDGHTCLVSVQVNDTGLGMTEEHVEQLYNIFFKVDQSLTRHQSGAGVGLPLVQGLLKLMNGELKVFSELGKGSVFTCTIPFLVGDEALCTSSADSESALSTIPDQGSLQGVHVLLAEDNAINALIATELLESFGCTVDVAEDGQQVLELLEQKQYDIVLMDLEMPRMNGVEATKRIRQEVKFSSIPIVAMSAHSAQDMRNNEELKGMQEYISKPFDPEYVQKLLYIYTRGEKKNFSAT